MNNYRSVNASIRGVPGCMYNEATETIKIGKFEDFGIYTNDNTYAVTFNYNLNRPPTKYYQTIPVRYPSTNQHQTKKIREPPVDLTDGKQYIRFDRVKPAPLLPPYLKKPEDLGKIKGLAREMNKGTVIYGPTHKVVVANTVY